MQLREKHVAEHVSGSRFSARGGLRKFPSPAKSTFRSTMSVFGSFGTSRRRLVGRCYPLFGHMKGALPVWTVAILTCCLRMNGCAVVPSDGLGLHQENLTQSSDSSQTVSTGNASRRRQVAAFLGVDEKSAVLQGVAGSAAEGSAAESRGATKSLSNAAQSRRSTNTEQSRVGTGRVTDLLPAMPRLNTGAVSDLVASFFRKIRSDQMKKPSSPPSVTVVEELGGPGVISEDDIGSFGEVRESVVACTVSTQVVVVVDAGSTKTRGNLLSYETEWCPGKGRRDFLDTLTHWGEGEKFDGMRLSIHNFIHKHIGDDYDATAEQDATLASHTDELQAVAANIVTSLLKSMEAMAEAKLSREAVQDAKAGGVPVFYHSTGGVRDLPGRCEKFFCRTPDEIWNYTGEADSRFTLP